MHGVQSAKYKSFKPIHWQFLKYQLSVLVKVTTNTISVIDYRL